MPWKGRHSGGFSWRRARTERHGTAPPAQAVASPEEEEPEQGPRRARLQKRKKKERRKRLALTVVSAVVATAAGVGIAAAVIDDEGTTPQPEESLIAQADDPFTTTLVFGTREGERNLGRQAIWMALLAYNSEEEEGSIIYIPAHTAVEVPGRGLQGVGSALGSGGVPLLLVSMQNLLSVPVDRYIELSDKDSEVLFGAVDPLSVNVPQEVRVKAGKRGARLIFGEGAQRLSASFLVDLLYVRGLDGDDVELGSRHLAFWDGLLEAYRDDPEALAEGIREAGGALAESDADLDEHAAFFQTLAELPSEDITISSLPVSQVSVGGSELYDADADEITEFIEETLGPAAQLEDQVRVQVLNGNGRPGIGQEVAKKLVGEGFRILLGGNARRLNYARTLIITYDSSEEGQALARRTRDLLGVGEVQVSAQSQGIVDLTIVVGKDFLRTL